MIRVLHGKLQNAEGGVKDKQGNALEAGELFAGQGGNRQECHDKQHQGDLQNQGSIHTRNGAGLGNGEGSQHRGNAGHKH